MAEEEVGGMWWLKRWGEVEASYFDYDNKDDKEEKTGDKMARVKTTRTKTATMRTCFGK